MKVLAIEDQPVSALQLRAVLTSLGHEVELVTNATDAWRQLAHGGFRAVVSDWRMPGMDGLDLCRMVRERGGDYVYYILISSTKITRESRAAAIAAGVDDFLSKPVDADELGMRLHVAERIISLTTQVKQLESFIPICSHCKKIRDDKKYWQDVETYFSQRQGARFSHGICPDCYDSVMAPQLRQLGIDPTLPPDMAKILSGARGENFSRLRLGLAAASVWTRDGSVIFPRIRRNPASAGTSRGPQPPFLPYLCHLLPSIVATSSISPPWPWPCWDSRAA